MAQTVSLAALPGFTMTIDLVDGTLSAVVTDTDDVERCAAAWQITEPD
ncbi:hypothetical protein [Rhodococcus ruber]